MADLIAAAVAGAEPKADAQAPAADGPRPIDPEKREKAQRRQAVRKLQGKLSAAADTDSFWKIVDELAKKNGRAVEVPKAGEKPATTSPAAGVIAPERIAKFDGPSRQLWEGVHQLLGALSTPFPAVTPFAAAMAEQEVKIIAADESTTVVKVDPIATLAGPTAKVAAKWLPDMAGGPEAELGQAIATVFVPVFAAMALEWFGAKIAAAQEEKPAEEKPVNEAPTPIALAKKAGG